MGCDIHAHIEIKLHGGDQWHHYGAPDIPRNYAMFGKIAHVRRNDEPALAVPTGKIPSDATEVTKASFELWRGDAHSVGMLNWDQVTDLFQWYNDRLAAKGEVYPDMDDALGYLFGNSFQRCSSSRPTTDLRMIFWFDN